MWATHGQRAFRIRTIFSRSRDIGPVLTPFECRNSQHTSADAVNAADITAASGKTDSIDIFKLFYTEWQGFMGPPLSYTPPPAVPFVKDDEVTMFPKLYPESTGHWQGPDSEHSAEQHIQEKLQLESDQFRKDEKWLLWALTHTADNETAMMINACLIGHFECKAIHSGNGDLEVLKPDEGFGEDKEQEIKEPQPPSEGPTLVPREALPSFRNLSDMGTDFFVAQIVECNTLLRPSIYAKDIDGKEILVAYYVDHETGERDYREGHTIIIPGALPHWFMDGRVGIRAEDGHGTVTVPCTLAQFHILNSELADECEDECRNCGKTGGPMSACSRCKTQYCGQACQTKHWKSKHKDQCKAIVQLRRIEREYIDGDYY